MSTISYDWYITCVCLGIENTDLKSLHRSNDKDVFKLS